MGLTLQLSLTLFCGVNLLVAMQAMAAHNSGGVVIVQVERVVDRGTLPTRTAHIPGAIVDKIVLAPPENHWMHLGSGQYDGSLSGELQ